MQDKKITSLKIVLAVVFFLCLFFTVGVCFESIHREMVSQMHQSLQSMAVQNQTTLEQEMNSRYRMMRSIADYIQQTPGSPQNTLKQLSGTAKMYHYKRMGYIDGNGMAYTTDGLTKNLSSQDFYQKGMKDQAQITQAMPALMDNSGDQIHVLSVPVYGKDGLVQGVLFATFQSEEFQRILQFDFFNGEANTAIIAKDGTVILSSAQSILHAKQNIYDAFSEYGSANRSAIHTLKSSMKQDKEGSIGLTADEQEYVRFMPVSFMDGDVEYYLLIMVSEQYLSELEEPLKACVNRMTLAMIGVFLVLVLVYFCLHRSNQKRIQKLLYCDALTQGDNYLAFQNKMLGRRYQKGYIISMDFCNFKIVNTTCGLAKGDEVLIEMWQILQNNIEKGELAAHMEGDKFILFFLSETDADVAHRIETLTEQIHLKLLELGIPHVEPAFGIYAAQKFDEVKSALGNANIAKNQIKGRRDQCYAFYNAVDLEKLKENQRMEDDFYPAIAQRRFEIWYQPKWGEHGRSVIGAEALVRWRDTEGNMVLPDKFISLFERNGMISKLDEYIFASACRQQKQWLDDGVTVVPVSVNISRASLYYVDIVERYMAILHQYDLDAKYIEFEITESAMINNPEALDLISKFRGLGFRVLVDDFGHGYSSAAMLVKAKFDGLKMDKSLVDGIGSPGGEVLLNHLTAIAKELGLSVTVEGVETEEQAEFVWSLPCNNVQGYYYSGPLTEKEYRSLLQCPDADKL